MPMSPSLRKLALTVHVTVSVGWAGALAVFLAHALVGVASTDEQIVRAASLAMGLAAWFVIMPLSVASLATGLVQALGTAWGLLRHYWVIFKLALTALATGVLFLKLQPIDEVASAAGNLAISISEHGTARISLLVHAAAGLLVLLAVIVLAIYKPAGVTGFGETARNRMPQWARWGFAAMGIFAAALVVMALFGAHGPRAHG